MRFKAEVLLRWGRRCVVAVAQRRLSASGSVSDDVVLESGRKTTARKSTTKPAPSKSTVSDDRKSSVY